MPSPLLKPAEVVKSAISTAARLLVPVRPKPNQPPAPVSSTAPSDGGPAPRAGRIGKYDEPLTALVARRPGVTVAQAAEELEVDPTALYPVIRRLEARDELAKQGRQLHPPLRAGGAPSRVDGLERLWCEQGHLWDRPRARGPKPKRCPEHRR